MDIKVTITKILKDETWGFSDLANGEKLTKRIKEDIKDLIMEDCSEIIDEGEWKIQQVK